MRDYTVHLEIRQPVEKGYAWLLGDDIDGPLHPELVEGELRPRIWPDYFSCRQALIEARAKDAEEQDPGIQYARVVSVLVYPPPIVGGPEGRWKYVINTEVP